MTTGLTRASRHGTRTMGPGWTNLLDLRGDDYWRGGLINESRAELPFPDASSAWTNLRNCDGLRRSGLELELFMQQILVLCSSWCSKD